MFIKSQATIEAMQNKEGGKEYNQPTKNRCGVLIRQNNTKLNYKQDIQC